MRKKCPINSYPDLSNKCRTLCAEYDRLIFEAIKSDRAIGIEEYLERPLLISHELFEAGCNDRDTRRLVFSLSTVITDFDRLLDMISTIYLNFWKETRDNVNYKVLFLIFECIMRLKPGCFFNLPMIRQELEKCSSNQTKYARWGKGKD